MSDTVHRRSSVDHESLHRGLVDRLVLELTPVRRLWPPGVRLTLWMLLEAGVLLLLMHHFYRPDLAQRLRDPWYLLGVAGFAGCGAIAAAFALRAAIPGRETGKIELLLLVSLLVGSVLLLFHNPTDEHVQLDKFIRSGVLCVKWMSIYAVVPWVALLWATSRGAPMSPTAGGALAGAAAFLFSFALMRIDCPSDERLHLLTWHLLPALIGIALSAGLGMLLLRRASR